MPRRIAVFLALVVAVAGACGDDEPVKATNVSVDDLRPGVCFNGTPGVPEDAKEEELTAGAGVVATVPCGTSHEKEVFGVFDHPAPTGALFPGEDAVAKVAQDGCAERFSGYTGSSYEKSELNVSVFAPGPEFWDKGDRLVVCYLFSHERLKGSEKAGGG
jgi:hypothetical protein